MFQVEKAPQELSFGRQGESNTLSYAFDFSQWAEDWPDGVASMTATLPNQTQAWPIPAEQAVVDGTVITLYVQDNLTAKEGRGTLIIRYEAGPNKKRSRVIEFMVEKGHAPAGPVPDPVEDWIADATSKLAEVDHFVGETTDATEAANAAAGLTNDAIGRANAISATMEGIAPKWDAVDISVSALSEGTAPTASITQDETGTSIALGIPKGDKGDTGNGIDNIARTSGDGSPGTTDTYTITYTDATPTTFTVYNGDDTTVPLANSLLWRKTPSGNPVSVYPVPESPLYPKVSGTFTQAGTGDPSPENIRPITPWLASGGTAKAKRTGKNLISTATLTTSTAHGITYVKNADGSVGISGTATADSEKKIGSSIALMPGRYAFGITTTIPATGIYVSIHNQSETMLSSTRSSASFTLSTGKTYGNNLYIYITAGVTCNFTIYPQLELGSTATPYEPYSGQEITLTAPQEIWGGWVDNEGNGRVTWVKQVFDGSESWLSYFDTGISQFFLQPSREPVHNTTLALVTSSHYKTNNSAVRLDKSVYTVMNVGTGIKSIAFNDKSYGDVDAWKTFLAAQYAAGTPVTVVYQLDTPVSITPASAPLTALPQLDRVTPRQNVLTASTGNVELTYAKSPIREADELAAAIAALS